MAAKAAPVQPIIEKEDSLDQIEQDLEDYGNKFTFANTNQGEKTKKLKY